MNPDLYSKKLQKLRLLEERQKLIKNLPHIYGYKFYPWARTYYESMNKMNILCAANQISKSSTQIRKCIDWSTNKSKWPILWPHIEQPRQFWYLYPSSYVATIEFEKKWIPEFLPRPGLKNHPVYGWRSEYKSRYIQAVHFNTGVSTYFKTYSQDPQDLQTGTCDAVFGDEEMEDVLFPELQARLFASDGYFHICMTPTLGQEFWREAIENRGKNERFKDALKLQVSMFDCLKYEDGSPSFWTTDRIQKIINACKSDAEVQRRVYGKFVLDSGLKYQAYSNENLIEPVEIPEDWIVYIGCDAGSGGRFNHPSAVAFIAFRPDYQMAYIFKGRRFDGIPTTNSDLVQFVMEMKKDLKNPVAGVFYDYSATDLRTIAMNMGEDWIPAEKSHLIGEGYFNVALKNKMLFIFNTEELSPMIAEIKSLKVSTPKNQAHDDFLDSARYALAKAPWDFSCISDKPLTTPERILTPSEKRIKERRDFWDEKQINNDEIEAEIDRYNELLDFDGYG